MSNKPEIFSQSTSMEMENDENIAPLLADTQSCGPQPPPPPPPTTPQMSKKVASGGKISASSMKNLELLNSNENYFPIRRSDDMKLDEQYEIIRTERRKTAHGMRAILICKDEEKSDEEDNLFIIFLSPSYNESKKFQALEQLVKDRRSVTFVSLSQVKQEGDMKIPIYHFTSKLR